MLKKIAIKQSSYNLPIFLPDATRGYVKGLDTCDLKKAGVEGVVVNTWHLKDTPGVTTLKKVGGIKKFMNFSGLVASDSGGFQIYSLIQKGIIPGKLTEEGIVYYSGPSKKNRFLFTPEDSIKIQFEIGSDIIICLDYFTKPNSSIPEIEKSVTLTTLWAKRCKDEFQKQEKERGFTDKTRPLLFAVVQGDTNKKERSRSAKDLTNLNFDGYGFGGWPKGLEMLKYTAKLLPQDKPKFALGVGKPEDIRKASTYGWDIFDCVLPTRDARHQRFYNLKNEVCNCYTCSNFSREYLLNLFKTGDSSAGRLAGIHNLSTYTKVIAKIREKKS